MIILMMMVTAMMMMIMDYYNYQTNVSLHLKREMRLKIMFAGKCQALDAS